MSKIVARPNLIFFYLSSFFTLIIILIGLFLLLAFLFFFFNIVDNTTLLLGFGFLFIILIGTFIYSYLYCINTSLILDNEKIIYEHGILHHSVNTVPIKNVTDFSLRRSFIQRFFNVATLLINTSGGQGFEIIAENFDYPVLFQIHSYLNSKVHKN